MNRSSRTPTRRSRGLGEALVESWQLLVAFGFLLVAFLVVTAPQLVPVLLASLLVGFAIARSRRDATTVLMIYVAVLIGIPQWLVVGPLQAVGVPSVLFGVGLLFLWVLGRVHPHLGLARGRQPVRLAIAFFALSVLASVLAATMRHLPTVELNALDRGLIFVAALAGVALFAADAIESRERLDTLLRWLSFVGVALAIIAIVQYTTGIDVAGQIRIPGLSALKEAGFVRSRQVVRRVLGTARHPIELGVVLAIIFPVALHYFSSIAQRTKSVLPWAGLAAMVMAIAMSVSRAGIVALIVGLLVLLPTWSPQRLRNAIPVVIAGAVVTRLLYPGLLGTIRGLFLNFNNDPSVQARTDDYETIIHYVGEAPIFGRGFLTFLPSEYILVDNQYLVSLVDIGFVGVFSLLVLWVVGASVARGARHRATDPATRDLGQSLAASILAGAVSFGTFDAFGYPMTTGVLFLLIGVSGALWRLQGQEAMAAPSTRHQGPELTSSV